MAAGSKLEQANETALQESQQLLQLWLQTKGFLARAFTETPVSPEEERAFLETKSAVSQYTRTVSQKLPSDVKIGGEKMQELLRQAISISHLRGLPKADKQTLIANWHAAFINLARAVGCLQFIVQGYIPTQKETRAGTGIKDLKGKKKKKSAGGAKKWIVRIIILAAIAAAYYYYQNR
jgi:hypothetical protein